MIKTRSLQTSRLKTLLNFTLLGVGFGVTFVLAGWILDIITSDLAFSLVSIAEIHRTNIVHYVVDLSPIVLGTLFYLLRRSTWILMESELTTRLLLDSTGEAIYGIDLSGACTFANKACLELLGYQSELDLLNKNMHQLIHHTRRDGSAYPEFECKIFKAFRLGQRSHVDDEVLWRSDGSSFDSEYRSFPIWQNSQTIGSVVSFSDISERTKARNEEVAKLSKLVQLKEASAEIIKISENITSVIGYEQKLSKIIATALDIERASIWYYADDDRDMIVQKTLYLKSNKRHEHGLVLSSSDFPNYFIALHEDVVISADDAGRDPRTSEFKESYLDKYDIFSMLDVPIRIGGNSVGVICLEQTGEKRHWDILEQDFAASASVSLALALESYQRIKSEARHRALLDEMIDGFITIDEDGIISSFNTAAENIFGYTADEVVAKNVSLFMPEPHGSQHHAYLERYLRTGQTHILGVTGREMEGLRKDGTTLPIAISISEMRIGDQLFFSGVIRDITERKQIERERELIALELGQLIDTTNAPIFGLTNGLLINEWNRAATEVIGHTKERMMGCPFIDDFVKEGDKKAIMKIFDDALLGKATSNFELNLTTANGGNVTILLNTSTRRDTEGTISGIIGIAQDVTEQRYRQKVLDHATKMEAIGHLSSGIAHDFNNLLSIIKGNLQFLQQDIPKISADVDNLFEDAISAADDGADLTRRLLAFSLNQSTQTEFRNVNDTIGKFGRFLNRTLAQVVELKIDLSKKKLIVNIDSSQLENALLNLSINARDSMPDGGTITIAVTRYHHRGDDYSLTIPEGEYVLISVSDTGCGIGSENLPHVYEPFFTTKAIGSGSGLGLSMVYGFVKRSNGACSITSRLGEGTTVAMYLPEVLEEVSKAELSSTQALAPGSEMILVVEDEPRVRRVTLRDLEELGYSTLAAENAEMAKAIMRSENRIDLMLSDINMPGEMNGLMLARWTRKYFPDMKVILISGFTEAAVNQTDIEPFPLIRKPYSIETLDRQLRAALEESNRPQ
ncbi:MAG TPA: PAS domain S-box protein [Pseudomonadales bacterium]|nr:PAS domain S-box protein [Pseudomonadales bacterium]